MFYTWAFLPKSAIRTICLIVNNTSPDFAGKIHWTYDISSGTRVLFREIASQNRTQFSRSFFVERLIFPPGVAPAHASHSTKREEPGGTARECLSTQNAIVARRFSLWRVRAFVGARLHRQGEENRGKGWLRTTCRRTAAPWAHLLSVARARAHIYLCLCPRRCAMWEYTCTRIRAYCTRVHPYTYYEYTCRPFVSFSLSRRVFFPLFSFLRSLLSRLSSYLVFPSSLYFVFP